MNRGTRSVVVRDEVRVVEPTGVGSAVDDPRENWGDNTVYVFEVRQIHRHTLMVCGMFGWCWLAGINRIVLAMLGVFVGYCLFQSVFITLVRRHGMRRAQRLRYHSWRPATVQVFSWDSGRRHQLVADFGSGEPLRLCPVNFDTIEQQVLARTRRIWLVGPDAKGQFTYCLAGLCCRPALAAPRR